MAGISAQGATFTFMNVAATVTGVSVDTPVAEVVDMTPFNAPAGHNILVPTGHWSGGSIKVDYICGTPFVDPQTSVRMTGPLILAGQGFSIARQAILESASVEARVGNLVRGTLTFRITDYYETEE